LKSIPFFDEEAFDKIPDCTDKALGWCLLLISSLPSVISDFFPVLLQLLITLAL
jgi:hypothetical protein